MSISSLTPDPEPDKTPTGDDTPKEANGTVEATPATDTAATMDAAPSAASSATVINEPPPVDPEVAKRKKATDLLLSMMSPVGTKANFKILIYGPPGGTKSSFLNVPNNLVYDQEDGLISMKSWAMKSGTPMAPNVQGIPFVSFNQANLLLKQLQDRVPEFDQFDVFSIDTMNDFHRKSLMSVVARAHANRPDSINRWVPVVEHHTENNEQIMDYIRRLRDLDRNIILTAHSKTVEPKNMPAKTYPDFSESLANKIEAMMDIVGYMEMRDIDGTPTPVMRIVSDGTVHAKSRIPLPDEISNPTYAQLKQAWADVVAYGNA